MVTWLVVVGCIGSFYLLYLLDWFVNWLYGLLVSVVEKTQTAEIQNPNQFYQAQSIRLKHFKLHKLWAKLGKKEELEIQLFIAPRLDHAHQATAKRRYGGNDSFGSGQARAGRVDATSSTSSDSITSGSSSGIRLLSFAIPRRSTFGARPVSAAILGEHRPADSSA